MARERGAIGARMTGAGFGGCTVNIVPEGVRPGVLLSASPRGTTAPSECFAKCMSPRRPTARERSL
ncbi:MAG: hypothetical protein MZW92_02700 [Comamonadaceae bacterium]|nr:hypothetical protein [Comamonadaceae bacterium]